MVSARKKRLSAREDAATPGKGHNSAHDPAKVRKVIVAAAKKQKKLDEERELAATDFRTRHKAITGEVKAVGISRKAFDHEYGQWLLRQNADKPEDERRVKAEEVVFRAECATVYEALNEGDQLDMFKVKEEAEKSREYLAKAAEQVEDGEEEDL